MSNKQSSENRLTIVKEQQSNKKSLSMTTQICKNLTLTHFTNQTKTKIPVLTKRNGDRSNVERSVRGWCGAESHRTTTVEATSWTD